MLATRASPAPPPPAPGGGPFRACLRCGSPDLRMPGVRDGVIVGMGQDLAKMACRRCDWVGVPLEFDDAAALAAYAATRTLGDGDEAAGSGST